MMPDFYDAANRHWKDGDYLFEDNRFANADHLFGFAAECALKAIMAPLDPQGFPGGDAKGQLKRHINKFWGEFITFAGGNNGSKYLAKYLAMLGNETPYDNWDANQRYEHGATITQQIANNHRIATQKTLAVLAEAIQDGVLTP